MAYRHMGILQIYNILNIFLIFIWYNKRIIYIERTVQQMEHSIRFPLPLNFHIGFVILSVILLILCYMKKKHAYELYMLIGVASTMLIYVSESKPFFYILGLEEIILFCLTVADMARVSKANAAAEKAAEEAPPRENEEEAPAEDDLQED